MKTLTINNLRKQLASRQIVNDISLKINSGEIIGLLGPNGAGKTTCFYMIVGLINCDSGQILLNELDITHLSMHERARHGVGYLPQEASVFRKLSVADNILAILELRRELSKLERQQKLEQLLAEFSLAHIANNLGMSLSGGERRRVEIARALAIEPEFILFDEPFAGIDPISIIDIKHIIRQLSERQIGILITDHNVKDTLDICHKGYIMNEGRMICSGGPDEILRNKQVREVYLGDEFYLD